MGRKKNHRPADEAPDVNATEGKGRGADRHKSKRLMRLPNDLAEALERLAERNDRPVTWELRRAVVAYLRANDALPEGYDGRREGG
jgi:hypothetical protein